MSHSVDHDRPATGSGVMHPSGLHRLLHPLWFAPVHTALAKAVAPRAGERVIDAGRLVLAEFRPAGPIQRPIRRLAASQRVGAPGPDAWQNTL